MLDDDSMIVDVFLEEPWDLRVLVLVTTQSFPRLTRASVVFDPTKPFRPPMTRIIAIFLL